MHPEKLGFEDCDISSIFKVIDKETQTNVANPVQNTESTSKTYKLPLPRELQKPEDGSIKVFSFCQVIQDPECPTSITIVRESVTEEVHSHSTTPDDEAFSNRYRYCKEVIKPYLKDYPPDCPDSGELLLRDAIITANEEFPEYPPCYEVPNPEDKKPGPETKKPPCETKKPDKPCTVKKTEDPKQEGKYIPTVKSDKPGAKPADDPCSKVCKKPNEKRHLIVCPNEKVPKICIEITDPQVCKEILKKQKEKECKKSDAPIEGAKKSKENCKEPAAKHSKEDICKEVETKKQKKDPCAKHSKEDICKEVETKKQKKDPCAKQEKDCPKESEVKSKKDDTCKKSDSIRSKEDSCKKPDSKRSKEDICKELEAKRLHEEYCKELEAKRLKEEYCKELEAKRSHEEFCKQLEAKLKEKDSCKDLNTKRSQENCCTEKPKKRIKKSPPPEDCRCKEEPPKDCQKPSHPEKSCKKPFQVLPPKPKDCQPEPNYCQENLYTADDEDDCRCVEEVNHVPCPRKSGTGIACLPRQGNKPLKSDKAGWPSSNDCKPCTRIKDSPLLSNRQDCLSKLLESLNVKTSDHEACKRKPKKMEDCPSDDNPKKQCVNRPKPVNTCCVNPKPSKCDATERKSSKCDITKRKSSKCDITKSSEKSSRKDCEKSKPIPDDGRCCCEKENIEKSNTDKFKSTPDHYKTGTDHKRQNQKTLISPSGSSKGPACDPVDGKNVKTAMQAHNETMATLKCAMEDFMCKVFRSTQDAVTLITTESAKQLEKLKKSSSKSDCPPPKKVSDTRNSRDNLRRFSVVNIDSSPADLSNCSPEDDDRSTPLQYLDKIVKKVDSAISMISDKLVEIPKPARSSNFNDSSSKYDIPISSRPLPKDIENLINPPANSTMFSAIKETLWSIFVDDENSEKGSVSKPSSVATSVSSESDEDLLNKMID